MAWLQLHQTLPTNKKTMRLKRLLKIKTPQAVGHLCMFWLWAMDNVENGDLSGFMNDEIAEPAGWDKDADNFVEALISSGFVDKDRYIHDWYEYIGKLLEKRQSEAVRVKKIRDKKKESIDNKTCTNDVCTVYDTVYDTCTKNVCTEEIQQSYIGKSRVDKSRVDKSTPPNPLTGESGEGESVETNIIDCSTQLEECRKIMESANQMFLPAFAADITMRLRSGVEFELIKEWLLASLGKNNVAAYFTKMAQSYYARGIKTFADYIAAQGGVKDKDIKTAKPKSGMTQEEFITASGLKLYKG